MGHHAQDVAARVLDAGDGVDRAVGVVDVAEHDLALALDAGQGLGVGEIVSVAVALGHDDLALALIAGGESGLAVGDPAFRFKIERVFRVACLVKSINITAGQTASHNT